MCFYVDVPADNTGKQRWRRQSAMRTIGDSVLMWLNLLIGSSCLQW